MPRTNWAGNVTFGAERVLRPDSVARLRQQVADNPKVRAVGAGHSFSPVADTTGALISLDDLPVTVRIDPERQTVTATAAIRYGTLAARLDAAGYALPNLASLPHISVIGACATGTHGSGDANRALATAVTAMDLVTADGELATINRDTHPDFPGMVTALGALGIVTSVTLDLVPAYTVRQWVYEDLPHRRLETDFAEIFASAYSVSVFTDWRPSHAVRVWRKQTTDAAPPQRWLDGRLSSTQLNPVPGMDPANTTAQLGVPGPWHERLPHFTAEGTPSSGDELQSEYLVPREHATEALAALAPIADRIATALQISEIRTIAGDDLWLSPCYQRDSAAIHFTWRKDPANVLPVLEAIEERLAPFAARPHWGKVFVTSPAELYPRLPDFEQLRARFDPAGKFRNDPKLLRTLTLPKRGGNCPQ
ncbi:MAG TPA: D-arabinono-1,4-lactone oxidase [Streptosporangiaceae bacterium]|nr:D-arabinono-1,4-lactone oxidase [Streptosporangiaceae bacterium]